MVGVAVADIGLGYHYKVPQTSYGVPSHQFSSGGGEYNTGYNTGSSASSNYNGQGSYGLQNGGYQPSTTFGGLNSGYQTGTGASNQYYQTDGAANAGFASSSAAVEQPSYQFNGGAAQSGYQSVNQYHTSSQYQSSAVQKYQEYYNQQQQQPAQVFKHFYVHAAPEEPEAPRFRQPAPLPPPQKHYKIIFIKTPSQTVYQPQYVPVQQQNEEKTIVYVLVKKPEEAKEIVLPKVEQKPPTKPEVFFIKYNNKDDSQAVINNIVNDYNKGQASASFASSGVSSGSGSIADGSGQYSQSGSTGQYTQGVGSGSGQYSQSGSTGQYTQGVGSSSGQYTQGSGQYSQSGGSGSYNSQALGAQGSQTVSDGTVHSIASVDTASNSNYDNANAISTSQVVPHETYGPPKFRV